MGLSKVFKHYMFSIKEKGFLGAFAGTKEKYQWLLKTVEMDLSRHGILYIIVTKTVQELFMSKKREHMSINE